MRMLSLNNINFKMMINFLPGNTHLKLSNLQSMTNNSEDINMFSQSYENLGNKSKL